MMMIIMIMIIVMMIITNLNSSLTFLVQTLPIVLFQYIASIF